MGIPYGFFRHTGPVRSLQQAAGERGQRPEQVVRSILFRLGHDRFAMVLVAGPRQVSWPVLRSYLGQSRLTLASEQEVLQVTGYPIGAVSPFGLPGPVRILVDESVFSEEEVSIGSGERNSTIIMKTRDLRTALEPVEAGEFSHNPA